jgi:hypothetical protein
MLVQEDALAIASIRHTELWSNKRALTRAVLPYLEIFLPHPLN